MNYCRSRLPNGTEREKEKDRKKRELSILLGITIHNTERSIRRNVKAESEYSWLLLRCKTVSWSTRSDMRRVFRNVQTLWSFKEILFLPFFAPSLFRSQIVQIRTTTFRYPVLQVNPLRSRKTAAFSAKPLVRFRCDSGCIFLRQTLHFTVTVRSPLLPSKISTGRRL